MEIVNKLLSRHSEKLVEAFVAAAFERVFAVALEVLPHAVRAAFVAVAILSGCDVNH